MPAQRPCASFDPIPPDFDLDALVEATPNFEYVVRISCDMIEQQGQEAFNKLVLLHVVLGGKPLVVEGFQTRLDKWAFTPKWLKENQGKKYESARNLTTQQNLTLSIGHYLKNMSLLTTQWTPQNYKDPDRQRIYLKDIDCPEVWHSKLKEQIPPGVFYLNDSTGDIGGPGAIDEIASYGAGKKRGKGVARAGDLMSSLPPEMRAENMQCYIGHEGTYTPAHREMCASLGHNLMVETSGHADVDGFAEKPGSSIWFMTESKDRHMVSEYWLDRLGHDIEVESHFAQINAWKAAPWTTYIVEQKVGDFILIPPLAPHQVWNRGTRTMKAAWNRTTVETLEMAINEALPRARMVCRDEQYKNKAIVYFSLIKYSELLQRVQQQEQNTIDPQARRELNRGKKILQLKKDFGRLFVLYTAIILSEMFSPSLPMEKHIEYLPYDSNVTCAYCRCNIFNRFLTCTTCVNDLENGEKDAYDICMECYVMGRSCGCLSKLKWVEQFPWKDLEEKHDTWRHQIIYLEGGVNEKSPQPLLEARARLDKKTLAQVCQEQLKARPWRDITKPLPTRDEDEEKIQVNGDGSVKKRRKKKRSDKWMKEHINCHICKHREEKWKLAQCSCGIAYCYGSLFRAFDLMPQQVMENPNWKCPKCLKICSCGACRRDPTQNGFQPRGTLLGHDTKKVADARSVESLVDFSHSNINWLKETEEDLPNESRRLKRRREEAEQAKSFDPELDDHYVDDDAHDHTGHVDVDMARPSDDGIPIDPSLSAQNNVSHMHYNHLHANHSQRPHGPLVPVATMLRHPTPPRQPCAASLNDFQLLSPQRNMNGHLAESSGPPYQSVAPAAMMINGDNGYHSEQTVDPNAVIYHYPDPTSPFGERLPTSQAGVPQSHRPHSETNALPLENGLKRKRQEERAIIQSDLTCSKLENDANRQYQQAQLRKTLAEAKKKGRLISAQAALNGKKLVVRLPVSKERLAVIAEVDKPSHRRRIGVGGDAVGEGYEDRQILKSDIPNSNGFVSIAYPLSHAKTRTERVEYFSPQNKPAGSGLSTDVEKPSTDQVYMEIDDRSDEFSGSQVDGAAESRMKAIRKPRVSAWLKRKNKDEPDGPTELPPPQPRKRGPRKPKSSPASNLASATSPIFVRESATAPEPTVRIVQDVGSDEFVEVDDNYNPVNHQPSPLANEKASADEVDIHYKKKNPRPRSTQSWNRGTWKKSNPIFSSDVVREPPPGAEMTNETENPTVTDQAEENRKAKLMAAHLDEDLPNFDSDLRSISEEDDVSEDEFLAPPSRLSSPKKTTNGKANRTKSSMTRSLSDLMKQVTPKKLAIPMFDRRKVARGKHTARRQTTGDLRTDDDVGSPQMPPTPRATRSGTTSATKRAHVEAPQDEEGWSDSTDEIPAQKPVPSGPPTRHSLRLSAGNSGAGKARKLR
ncbi:MAG: hypothetical protein M1835_004186 [Candelina submexicana]|nr:MAG: hypothetical protein M1835_004186 [Candelina submexicana]